ncbi:hypothetical protein Tco_0951489 [Tanacetum coccineum]|uniref:Uncharacterized protein n=1 Tax=Tanacetum coccineum TaxID=301880 RepID=A0ABQ5E114_9ASTR
MLTQQDIYAAGSKNRLPMLNKDNYVLWSSRLLHYAKSKPNGKIIYISIMHGPYVGRMIPEPRDREVPVAETFHEHTDDELTDKEVKQMKDGDQAIQTILMGLPKTSMLLLIVVKLLRKSGGVFHQDQLSQITYMQQPIPNNNFIPQPSFNQNYMQQPILNPEDISDPTTAMNMELVLMAKEFKLNYSTPTNNNQIISSNPCNRQIAQPGMNIGQDRQMHMVRGNGGNQFRQFVGQHVGNQNGYNAVQNVGNQNGYNAIRLQDSLVGYVSLTIL